jgi:hypothetical protein
MADRAHYLARTLIGRLSTLQTSFAEDGRGEPDRWRRIEAIEKVLAVELGITDGTTAALIEAAVPNVRAARQSLDQEVAGFADFLRRRLAGELAES